MRKIFYSLAVFITLTSIAPSMSLAQSVGVVERGPTGGGLSLGGEQSSGGEVTGPGSTGASNTCGTPTTTTTTTTTTTNSCPTITVAFVYSGNPANSLGMGLTDLCEFSPGGCWNSTDTQYPCLPGDCPYPPILLTGSLLTEGINTWKALCAMCNSTNQATGAYAINEDANFFCGGNGNACKQAKTCNGQVYAITGYAAHTPLKVNIEGADAKLNTDNQTEFKLKAPDGKYYVSTTYGGLNHGEAWLMIDRDGTGKFVENGVINGDNWFTDHEAGGQEVNGYEDLFNTLTPFIKQDEQGRNYIPLHHIEDKKKAEEKEASRARASKHKGYERPIDPSLDLKLVDDGNNLLFASDYFSRIYVDYTKAREHDRQHKNFIWQRAPVLDVHGDFHTSADQWFVLKSSKALN